MKIVAGQALGKSFYDQVGPNTRLLTAQTNPPSLPRWRRRILRGSRRELPGAGTPRDLSILLSFRSREDEKAFTNAIASNAESCNHRLVAQHCTSEDGFAANIK